MKKITLLFIMALGIFASCQSDSNDNSDSPTQGTLIKKAIVNDGLGSTTTTEYSYLGNKLLKVTRTQNNIEIGRSVFTYSNNLILKEEVYQYNTLTITYNYEYDANQILVKCIKKDLAYDEGTKWIYTHTSSGDVTFNRYSGDLNTQTTLYSTGVITPTTHEENILYGDGPEDDSLETRTYTYDDKIMPIVNIIGMDKVYFVDNDRVLNFQNNALKRVDQAGSSDPYNAIEITEITYYPNNFVKTAKGKIDVGGFGFYREVYSQYFY